MIGVIGLLLAILVMILGAYKGLPPLPLTLLAGLVAILTNGLNVWAGYSTMYVAGYAGTYSSYFLIFIFSALYAKFMEESGCATAVGYKLIDWFGTKHVLLVLALITSVLTYGGVSLFVVIFAVSPIAFTLMKEANLPRHLIVASLVMGSSVYTMTSLPGTPALTNIIPTQYLGTTMTAAPVLGIICSVAMFVLCYLYLVKAEKKAVRLGEVWSYPEGADPSKYEAADRSTLPSAGKAFIPIIVLLLIIIVGGFWVKDSSMLTVVAMLVGSVLCYVFNVSHFKGKNMRTLLGNGLGGGISAIGGLAAVVAFGTIVQNTAAYQNIVEWLMGLSMHPYLKGIFSTAVISGITGSSSGGLRLTLTSLSEFFLNSGCNPATLHRLMAIAAGSLDTLPHSAGLFLVLQVLGLNHKNSYRHMFWTSVAIPAVTVIVATLVCMALGL
ncbi:GntP family permease [Lawsonibacter celer]|uniref:GntP family permease n=1 Tax=Lawsonibacter celer TaxID=2986526 RepID=UPI0016447D27|nr:GntP family permease [Lawsonibacter celer]